jgi:hypothetical protein
LPTKREVIDILKIQENQVQISKSQTPVQFFFEHPNALHLSVGGEDVRVTLVKDSHGGATEELSTGGSKLNLSTDSY